MIGAFSLPELLELSLLDDSEDSELSDSAELSDDELLELEDCLAASGGAV